MPLTTSGSRGSPGMSAAPEIAQFAVPWQPGPGRDRPGTSIGELAGELLRLGSGPVSGIRVTGNGPVARRHGRYEIWGLAGTAGLGWMMTLAPGMTGPECGCDALLLIAGAATLTSGGERVPVRTGRVRVQGRGNRHRLRADGGPAVTLHVSAAVRLAAI